MQRGYVYIIMMSSAHPYLKIGKTAGPTEKRAAELSSDTGVPLRYAVAYEVELLYYEEAEWEIHARLKHCRVNPRREFFEIPLKDAIRVVEDVARKYQERERAAIAAEAARRPWSLPPTLPNDYDRPHERLKSSSTFVVIFLCLAATLLLGFCLRSGFANPT